MLFLRHQTGHLYLIYEKIYRNRYDIMFIMLIICYQYNFYEYIAYQSF